MIETLLITLLIACLNLYLTAKKKKNLPNDDNDPGQNIQSGMITFYIQFYLNLVYNMSIFRFI